MSVTGVTDFMPKEETRERFIRTLIINGRQTYIIADYNWWHNHNNELQEWMEKNTEQGRDTQEGMTLAFATPQEELMFMLRWR